MTDLEEKREYIEHLQEVEIHLVTLLNYRDKENERLSLKLEQKNNDINQLIHWVDAIERANLSLLNSKRWRMAKRLGELKRKILFQPRVHMPEDFMEKVFQEYKRWRQLL